MTASRLRSFLMLFVGLTHPTSGAWAQACAMCKTALANADEATVRAFNWSILLLLSAPYLLAGSVGGWLFYAYWRGRAARPVPRVVRFRRSEKEGVQ
jgi:hypothetical protein